jgi:hypothetical protein
MASIDPCVRQTKTKLSTGYQRPMPEKATIFSRKYCRASVESFGCQQPKVKFLEGLPLLEFARKIRIDVSSVLLDCNIVAFRQAS